MGLFLRVTLLCAYQERSSDCTCVLRGMWMTTFVFVVRNHSIWHHLLPIWHSPPAPDDAVWAQGRRGHVQRHHRLLEEDRRQWGSKRILQGSILQCAARHRGRHRASHVWWDEGANVLIASIQPWWALTLSFVRKGHKLTESHFKITFLSLKKWVNLSVPTRTNICDKILFHDL